MNFSLHRKHRKMTIFQRVLSSHGSYLNEERSDRANIFDLAINIDNLSFKIVKSKIEDSSPDKLSGGLVDRLLNSVFVSSRLSCFIPATSTLLLASIKKIYDCIERLDLDHRD